MKAAPHIGQMLRKHVKQKRIFQSGWARKQGITAKAIGNYLKRPTMRIDTLFTICQVLEYNFFTDIAQQLPAELPPAIRHENEQQFEIVKQENEQLKLQVATLKETLGLVGRR